MNKLAKLGLAVPLLAGGAVVGGNWRFKKMVEDEVRSLFAAADQSETAVVTEEMIAHLPEPVQRYLAYTGVVGKPMVHSIRLRQKGRLRTTPQQPWLELTAEEYYTVSPPGFIWYAQAKMAGLPLIPVRDMYRDGAGYMLVTLAGLIPVVNATGKEMNQGAMTRFLNEMVWFPAALLRDNITWTAVDDHAAQVTFTHHGDQATATLFFDDEGKLVNFEAQRYMMENGRYAYARWSTPMSAYGEMAGLKLPAGGSAVWHLASGDFKYVELELTDLEYNQPALY